MVRHGNEFSLVGTCGEECGRDIIQALLRHVGSQIQHGFRLFEFAKSLISIAHNIRPVIAGNSRIQHIPEISGRISLGNDLNLRMVFLQIGNELIPCLLVRGGTLPVGDLDLCALFCRQAL